MQDGKVCYRVGEPQTNLMCFIILPQIIPEAHSDLVSLSQFSCVYLKISVGVVFIHCVIVCQYLPT